LVTNSDGYGVGHLATFGLALAVIPRVTIVAANFSIGGTPVITPDTSSCNDATASGS